MVEAILAQATEAVLAYHTGDPRAPTRLPQTVDTLHHLLRYAGKSIQIAVLCCLLQLPPGAAESQASRQRISLQLQELCEQLHHTNSLAPSFWRTRAGASTSALHAARQHLPGCSVMLTEESPSSSGLSMLTPVDEAVAAIHTVNTIAAAAVAELRRPLTEEVRKQLRQFCKQLLLYEAVSVVCMCLAVHMYARAINRMDAGASGSSSSANSSTGSAVNLSADVLLATLDVARNLFPVLPICDSLGLLASGVRQEQLLPDGVTAMIRRLEGVDKQLLHSMAVLLGARASGSRRHLPLTPDWHTGAPEAAAAAGQSRWCLSFLPNVAGILSLAPHALHRMVGRGLALAGLSAAPVQRPPLGSAGVVAMHLTHGAHFVAARGTGSDVQAGGCLSAWLLPHHFWNACLGGFHACMHYTWEQ